MTGELPTFFHQRFSAREILNGRDFSISHISLKEPTILGLFALHTVVLAIPFS